MHKKRIRKRLTYVFLVGILLVMHGIGSWGILVFSSAHSQSFIEAYIPPFIYGIASTIFFLYVFSHDDVIKVAKYLEEKERKAERAWLKRFAKAGKVGATALIGMLLGTILFALSIKLLLPKYRYKYILIFIVIAISTFYYVAVLKGAVHILF